MINNFESQTHELKNEEENVIVPMMVQGLKTKIGKENAITNKEMIAGLKKYGHKTNPARVRKMIHYIRINGLVERLVATSNGYYISNDKNEIKVYIESLMQRAESIEKIAKQLNFQLNKMS